MIQKLDLENEDTRRILNLSPARADICEFVMSDYDACEVNTELYSNVTSARQSYSKIIHEANLNIQAIVRMGKLILVKNDAIARTTPIVEPVDSLFSKSTKCSFCGKEKIYAKGLCRSCYARNRLNGSPEYKRIHKESDEQKFVYSMPWKDAIVKKAIGEIQFCKLDDFDATVDCFLESLPDREREVITLRNKEKMTLQGCALRFGVTRERIRQIEAKALRKLRHPSRSRKLKDYTID